MPWLLIRLYSRALSQPACLFILDECPILFDLMPSLKLPSSVLTVLKGVQVIISRPRHHLQVCGWG